ncbi:integrator complex subunit 15-like isoform X1 [Biomphalaria glabrata]|uniref:Integrator complex subunit 15-like isoform X1 n=1 Tax=Biomphalaria glabrata TaxID=6526 RepID=A0A9U8E3J2_BIOGL|nr:integrator complex subunit 15-like isoform X1 [Biomphalaria glabrata]XP_013070196.2 integrator complex subunit 15-like isoform X1 [Biomphalaria glabrata]XP_013070213.2 integrator complex subunit 15-like isoform X1 [Biomphalaria glabrata]XP_013070221.2 integrator complex subunit 15-like isoform X1 [Biomphalaria glabrata]XP_013070228.2 integrator complex subunit 15-like isoform X1 [Biomphalaria glabrata]XP_055875925.1 integrator complex subunit 15-like isoform X1 [Biomphalaria glabrata]XP_05
MSADILSRLYRLNFPDCTKEALAFLTSFISQDCPKIPGLNANTEQIIVEICQEFVLFKSARGPQKKLNAVQELHLLDMICTCFSEAPEKSKYRIFNLMFGARGDGTVNLLTKLLSLAMSVKCIPVLFCAAIWMQERDSLSPDVKGLTQRLVSDYCILYPEQSTVFTTLPSVSPLFACNLVTAATSLYSFAGADSLPPLTLVQHVSEWVYKDNTMCCESLRQAAIHSAYTTPVPGLTGWCVRGPLVCCQLREKSDSHIGQAQIDLMLSCLDKLHLALLQSLTFTASVNLSPGLISASDLAHIAQTLQVVFRPNPSKLESLACNTALERLAQILQVASCTRTYIADRGKIKEIETLAKLKLPYNRLLTMVLSNQLQSGRPYQSNTVN